MKRAILVIAALLVLCLFAGNAEAAKNVIIMIGDGMGANHVKAGSYYLSGSTGNLSFDPYYKCTVTTRSLNSSITDSAAAATAIATGYKTNNGVIGQSPSGTPYQSILELAKAQGKRTGLVTVDPITGATPAGFGAHESSRNNYINIGSDYLNGSQPELIFGGGNPAMGGSSYFSASQVTTAQSQGYQLVSDTAQMDALDPATTGKALGLFAGTEMTREHNRTPDSTQPHLSQMAAKALGIMEQDPDGFFMMIEGANIDHSAHDNNIQDVTHEVVEFHNTVQAVLDWMQGRDDTMLIVTADHETGGLSVTSNGAGNYATATWSTTGHTGTNVNLYTTGWGASLFNRYMVGGVIDNTDIYKVMNTAVIPEPGAITAVFTGLACLAGLARRRTR